jgi:NAD(P)-dependent dehydrogenase (short-subunit alcohol dehydrogenase family)
VSILDLSEPSSSAISGSRVKFVKTDVTKVEDIERAVDDTVLWAKEKGKPLGGVICCAGVGVAAKVNSYLSAS